MYASISRPCEDVVPRVAAGCRWPRQCAAGSRTSGASSDGVDRSASRGPGNGNATSSQRFAALSVAATPVTSTTRSWPAAGQFNLTRIRFEAVTALSRADCNSRSTARAAVLARWDCIKFENCGTSIAPIAMVTTVVMSISIKVKPASPAFLSFSTPHLRPAFLGARPVPATGGRVGRFQAGSGRPAQEGATLSKARSRVCKVRSKGPRVHPWTIGPQA